jgi:2-(1,2-epoxy-1,2-dihydrophenyl)acetyl-CoA isomerase
MSDDILLERRDGGAHVTFNRPAVRNAITRDMLAALDEFLIAIRGDPDVRYVLFQGAGDHFAAGGDVASFAETLAQSPEERRQAFEARVRKSSASVLSLSRLDVPVIAAVRGAVAGAGLVFTLAADFCIAADDALFVFAHARVGLPLDMGTSFYLPRVVGRRQARMLTLTSARVDAVRALAIGLAGKVVPGDALDGEVAATLAALARGPRAAFRLSRALLDAGDDGDLEAQIEREALAVGAAVAHPDFAEGVRAFLEQRTPDFGKSA